MLQNQIRARKYPFSDRSGKQRKTGSAFFRENTEPAALPRKAFF